MKIIIIGAAHPYRGGLATYNERLAREYAKQGNDVEIITFSLQYPKLLFPGKNKFSDEPVPHDIKINRSINTISPTNWIKVGLQIKKKAPDLVIYCYWMAFTSPCYGTIARYASSSKTKMVAMIHDINNMGSSFIDRHLPRFFVKAMDGFVAMADSVIKDLNDFDIDNKPKIVSPHPVYDHFGAALNKKVAAMKLGIYEQKKYILYFGYIQKNKGLDLLLEAFADERIRKMPVKLIIAGDFYENPEPYLHLIHKLELENNIVLRTGFIPDKEVRNYFSVADLIALPYRTATQSGVTQIAYHFEKPMLVTNVGSLADTIPNGKVGYVVDVNPKQIADALVDFFSNNRSPEFIENIKVEKQKYLWSRMTEAIDELIK